IDHPGPRAGFYDDVYLMRAFLPDQIRDCVVVEEELISGKEPASDPRDESLRENAKKTGCKLGANLILLFAWKRIYYSIYGLSGVVRMKSREHEVPCLRCSHSRGHCFRGAHFADQDHIYVLAENRFECHMKIAGIDADFSLIDYGFIRNIHMFNRIFDGDNIAR